MMDNSRIEIEPSSKIAEWLLYLKELGTNERLPWDIIYEIIFCDDVIGVIRKRFQDFTWSDPDSSYSDDVCSFIDAFVEYDNDIDRSLDQYGFNLFCERSEKHEK